MKIIKNQFKNKSSKLIVKLIAILCISLFLITPVAEAQRVNSFRIDRGEERESIAERREEFEERIGEDIIVNIDSYQPRVIRAGLLEEQRVDVYALLVGIPSNPTLTIPRIIDVNVRVKKVTTKPEGKKVGIGYVRHLHPRVGYGLSVLGFREELSYRNFGYLIIPISRIRKEEDVPDEINIDMEARIYFDVSEGLTFGKHDDVLIEQTEEQWLEEKDRHGFFGGFIRASEIKDDKVSFVLYDDSMNELRRPLTVAEGRTSGLISSYGSLFQRPGGWSNLGSIFDKFRIRVNEIRRMGDRADFLIFKDGKFSSTVLTEDADLYDGSEWKVEDIKGLEVKLRNKRTGKLESLILKRKIEEEVKVTEEKGEEVEEKKSEKIESKEELESKVEGGWKDDYSDFDDIINSYKTIVEDEAYSSSTRDKALTTLFNIQVLYFVKREDIKREIEGKKEEELNKLNEKLENINKKYMDLNDFTSFNFQKLSAEKVPLKEKIPESKEGLYESAISAYRRVISDYPNAKHEDGSLLAARSMYAIANIYVSKGDMPRALVQYNNLLSLYKDDISVKSEERWIKSIIDTLEKIKYDFDSEVLEEETGDITVTLTDVIPMKEKERPSATIEINGKEIEMFEGDFLNATWDYKWKIKEVKDKKILITRIVEGREISEEIGKAEEKIRIGGGETTIIKVIDTTLKREVYITILPNIERAYTESDFSIHLPIEKRAIGLPLFSDTLDEEINKTEELIKRLDKIINNVKKIHETWTKFCYATFGTLWVKNLVTGFTGTNLARKRVMEKWRNKYEKLEPEEKRRKSFDRFAIENVIEINKDVESGKKALQTTNEYMKNEDYLIEFGITEEDIKTRRISLEDVRELKFQEEMVKNIAPERKTDYIESHILLRRELSSRLEKETALDEFHKFIKTDVDKQVEEHMNKFGISEKDKERVKQTFEAIKKSTFRIPKGSPSREMNVYIGDIKYKDGYAYYIPEPGVIYPIFVEKEHLRFSEEQIKERKIFDIKNLHIGDSSKDIPIRADTKKLEIEIPEHKPLLYLKTSGRHAGLIDMVSIDAYRYVQVEYTTGGMIKEPIKIYSRDPDPYRKSRELANTPLGAGEFEANLDILIKKVSDELEIESPEKKAEKRKELDALGGVRRKINELNRKLGRRRHGRGDRLDEYSIDEAAPVSVGPSCTDYMSPTDCKLLFNACDPVICPASRCNAGGRWQVKNVVETGIVGSVVLCAPNIKEGIIMPICITGILAGLENIKSILRGYSECLKVSKVKGEPVGICDKIRSVYICDMLWREAIAIFRVEGGLLGLLSKKFFDKGAGGGEYANFKESIQDSVGSLRFFTQDYAENVFAGYAGGSLDEIGVEICKSAIFGKAPGIGDFFDQITRPESPPQFVAFFDEIPYSDIPPYPESQYQVYFHIYAGENEDVRYTVYLRAADTQGQTYFPILYVYSKGRTIRNVLLRRGEFDDVTADFTALSGYNEICVEIRTDTYGKRTECGFGKVTTDYGINRLTEAFTAREMQKRINSEEECVPETGRLTSLSYSDVGFTVGGDLASSLGRAAVGSYSTGSLQTGIVRTCSAFSPGVGLDINKWVDVGTCGKDERGRDLGRCWLYRPLVDELIKDTKRREIVEKGIKNLSEELAREGIKGVDIYLNEKIQQLMKGAKGLRADGNFKGAIEKYSEIITHTFDENMAGKAQFEIGKTYEEWAKTKAIEEKEKAKTKIKKETGLVQEERRITVEEERKVKRKLCSDAETEEECNEIENCIPIFRKKWVIAGDYIYDRCETCPTQIGCVNYINKEYCNRDQCKLDCEWSDKINRCIKKGS